MAFEAKICAVPKDIQFLHQQFWLMMQSTVLKDIKIVNSYIFENNMK